MDIGEMRNIVNRKMGAVSRKLFGTKKQYENFGVRKDFLSRKRRIL